MADPLSNPYVGPRPFEEAESAFFFGRRDETRQLAALVIAQRVVVFHAPSGAGKTSLLKASLIPLLKEQKKIVVLPIGRVSGRLTPNVDPNAVANIYVYNALVTLHSQETLSHELISLTLQEGLKRFVNPLTGERGSRPRLLIIDQFEELFTTHQARHEERAGFFRQLQQSLAAYPQLSLLIAMRDDYIAHLDFHAAQMPDRLRTRFRIERLSARDALEAIQGPAAHAGTPFAPGVAEALLDNLRRVQPGAAHGSGGRGRPPGNGEAPHAALTLSAYVEPVHLQLVCRQLWEKLPPMRTVILAEDAQKFGDVDQALIGFYENAMQAVVAHTAISQRRLRTWFNTELITPARTRGLVYRGETQTAGLENAAIDILNNAYIIRADIRGYDIWVELAHDRLVEPVLAANVAWLAAYRNPLAEVTAAWQAGGRNESYLLAGDRLAEAQRFAAANPHDLLDEEQEFLKESLHHQAEEQEKMRQIAKRRRSLAGAAVAVIIALSLLTLWAMNNASLARTQEEIANNQRATAEEAVAVMAAAQSTTEAEANNARRAEATAEAERAVAEEARAVAAAQARLASSRELAAAAISNLPSDPELSILLALRAISVTYTAQAENALHQALQASRAVQTLEGHIGPVNAVAVAPDESRLFTAGADGVVVVWDAANGEQQFSFAAHRAPINRIALNITPRNELWLATAGDDGRIRLWALNNGPPDEPLLDLADHRANVLGLAFSSDGALLATSGQDARIRLWSLAANSFGRPIATLGESAEPVVVTGALAFSPNGEQLAAGGADGSIAIWDLASGRPLLALAEHTARVFDIAFSPDGAQVATAAWDNARLWDSNSGVELQRLTGHTAEVRTLAFRQGRGNAPTLLATAGNDRRVKLWDVTTGQEQLTLAGHQGSVLGVAFFPVTLRLATAGEDGAARLWTIGPSEELLTLSTGGVAISDLSFTTGGAGLAALDDDGIVHVWNLATGKETVRRRIHAPGAIGSAGFNEGGTRLALGVRAEAPSVWELATLPATEDGRPQESGQPQGAAPTGVRRSITLAAGAGEDYATVALDVHGDYFATSSTDRFINIWHSATGERRHQLAGHRDIVLDFAFSLDGARYASASADGTAIVWDAATGRPRLILRGHTGEVRAVAFRPDGASIVTGGEDGLVKLWDSASGRESLSLAGHSARLSSVHFSPDGLHLVTASGDKTAKVWDPTSGEELLSFSGDTAALVDAIISPDGKLLATASTDGFVRLYTLDVRQLVSLAHKRVTRSLTDEECAKYLHVEQCPPTP
jgi:WD40 repeat protein